MAKSTFLYDQDCGFCIYWSEYWEKTVGKAVDFQPFQKAYKQFPQLSEDAIKTSSQFIDEDGQVFTGAQGVFEMLSRSPKKWWLKWLYERIPPFRAVTEFGYKRISSCRHCAVKATQWFWGGKFEPSKFVFTRGLFLRLLGAIYLIAFVSFYVQIPGLIGVDGILPAGEFLNRVSEVYGSGAVFNVPTLAWISASDTFLQLLAFVGAATSLFIVLGLHVAPVMGLVWLLYLSLMYVGQRFMSFQWDILLLEAGFLAIFFAPLRFSSRSEPSNVIVWLYRFLVFRVMFFSGFVKLASGDETWRNLSALDYHYFTQPIPNPLAWFAHQLPAWFDRLGVFSMFVIQLMFAFFIFGPRRLRFVGAFSFIFLEVLILLTGNYTYFNVLTIVLILLLFDDQFFGRTSRKKIVPETRSQTLAHRWLAGIIVFLFLFQIPTPLRIVNSYGLFANMTEKRYEIVIEGSNDQETWEAYTFKYKPGELTRQPPQVAPYQPRLDWQMWFAALSTYERNPWFVRLVEELLQGSAPVEALFEEVPFESPPRYIRAALYDYEFTTSEEREETGAWWKRKGVGLYLPVTSLK